MYGRDEPDYSRSFEDSGPHTPVIRVVGVGGAGVNAVNRMVEAGIPGVEFMAINTDLQSLQQSLADVTVHLGTGASRGLGAGSNPELGYRSAFEEQDKIKRLLKGSDMVFVAAGAGGGTGTGAAPVVARLARDVGALTVGIVTKPFRFEGTRRASQADDGVDALAAEVDTLIVVPNEKLLSVLAKNTTMIEAFSGRRRRASPGRPGDLRADHPPRAHQPRLRRRPHHDARRRPGPARHRHGRGGQPCGHGRREGCLVTAPGDVGDRGALDPALDHVGAGPDAARGLGRRKGRPGGRASRREHHLRRQHRRVASTTRSGSP